MNASDDVRVTTAEHAAADGTLLFEREWSPGGGATRGLQILHGLGEHGGRYDALARRLASRGWRVRAHDHFGHGRSAGQRGTLARPGQFAEHATERFDAFAASLGRAPVLLGHSLGGALAAELVVTRRLPAAALVLSSPALDPGIGAPQRLLAAVLSVLAPSLTLGNGLDPQGLSHDPRAVRAYLDDPLVHDRVSARLVRWLVAAGEGARARAATLAVPALLLVAGADRLVDPAGSRAFADAAPAGRASLRWYADLYHEIFNEAEDARARVFADLDDWLDGLDRLEARP